MGPDAFNNYLASIRAKIGNLNDTVTYLVAREEGLKKKVEDNPDENESAGKLEKTQNQLAELHARISTFNAFYVDVAKRWSNVNERIIGYVVWAPKNDVSAPPYGHARDFCVIRLDKKKFKNGFLGNTLSLGALC